MKLIITFLAILFSGVSFASEEIKFHNEADNTYVAELISSNEIGEKKGLDIIKNASKKNVVIKPLILESIGFKGKRA